jgi:hypothetical protein
MLAAIRQDIAPPRRVRMQRPVSARMGLGLWLRLAFAIGFVPLGGFPNSASNASTRFVSTPICFVSASISAINSSFENEVRLSRFIESLNRRHRHPSTTFCAQPTSDHQPATDQREQLRPF